jgi:hypothetical protein
MAKIELDPAFTSFRGGLGNFVYRKTSDGIIASQRVENTAAPTAAQLAVRQRFSGAAAYAKSMLADPVEGPRYLAAAAAKGMRPVAFAVADFLTPPAVQAVAAAGYHGAVGDVIIVRATDDFEVRGVTVALRDAANAVLEQGAAVLADGRWHYTAIAAGTAVTIEAVATDRPGHTGSLQHPLVVA